MHRLAILPAVLLLALAAPAAAQSVPDNIPDVPGESPTDRATERFVERHRGFLSRLYSAGSFDAGALPGDGLAYQTNASFGLELPGGDAVFLAVNSRILPDRSDPLDRDDGVWVWYVGVGYTLNGTRLLGDSESARRSALSAELGAWGGEASVVALDLSPTYEIYRGSTWSVPLGVRFSLARIESSAGTVVDPFIGLTIGGKFHFFARERLESK